VSIGIRGWRKEFASEAIESVLAQGRRDVEIVVGDDSGELGPLVKQFGDARIRYMRNSSRLGPDENGRRVLALARADVVGLLDEDDRLLPGYLDAVLGPFATDASLGVVFANHYFDEGAELRLRDLPLAGGRHEGFLPAILSSLPAPTSGTLIRKEVWKSGMERFPQSGSPGHLWTAVIVHAAATGWPFFYVDRPLMVYRVHPHQLTAEKTLMRQSGVGLWDAFSFEDPECERLRSARLADALLSRAAMLLQEGRPSEARSDIDRAVRLSPRSRVWRAHVLRLFARRPWLLPAAGALRRVVRLRRRPGVERRPRNSAGGGNTGIR
jgi:glycosyltransferase involved in cell wall biosynthesis